MEVFVAAVAARHDLLVRVSPLVGVVFKGSPSKVATSMGVVSSAVLDEVGDVLIAVSVAGSVGAISLASSSVFKITMAIEAGGPCFQQKDHTEQLSALWTIAALPPPSSLIAVTMMTFRYATAVSAVLGHPINAMTSTGLVSILSLEECMFSDVDPLDSSVSPITSAAVGPTVGQYYRGAVVVAMSMYGGVCCLALSGALLLRWRVRTQHFASHFATLRFPSVGVLLVGLFGQGLATCGMSLIRLGESAGDIALGVASLLVCVLLAVLAGLVTTAWLQARVVKQKPTARRRGWAGRFLSYAVWPNHWQDTSGGLQFKQRYFLLLDDLQRPWWTAVEMSSSVIQGCILGLRIDSITVCRGQLWALTAHCVLLLVAAVYFRPCGAALSNVFLLLSKLGASLISLLVLLHSITLVEAFAQAAEVATSVSTAVASLQVVVQVLLFLSTSPLYRWFQRAFRKSNAAGRRDEPEPPLDLSLGGITERGMADVVVENRFREFAGQTASAISRREVMQQLMTAADPRTPRNERLFWLLRAAIAEQQLRDHLYSSY